MKKTTALVILILLLGKILPGQDFNSTVNHIDEKVDSIDRVRHHFDSLHLNLGSESTEGGEARMFYDQNGVKKVIANWHGESSKRELNCYYAKKELIFASELLYKYNRPFYWDEKTAKESGDDEAYDPAKTIVDTLMYYFKNEQLIFLRNKEDLDLGAESKAIMMNEIKTRCNSFRDTLVYRKLVPPNTDRSSEALQAAFKPVVIKDPDGFTNVRSGRSEEHEIIGQIQNDEIFYCR